MAVGVVRLFFTHPERNSHPVVEWTPGRFALRVRHPRADLVQTSPDFYRRGNHSALVDRPLPLRPVGDTPNAYTPCDPTSSSSAP